MVNFFSLKWGNKYDAKYVNRVYGSLRNHCDLPFQYTCITDDTRGLHPNIRTRDLDGFDPFPYPKDQIFTREKLSYFREYQEGTNVWLDLDILIHGNITHLLGPTQGKPTLIWNHWNPLSRSYDWYGKGGSCHVNSSFVKWTGTDGMDVYNFLLEHEKEAFFTYKSLDKFLFYQCHRKGMLDYWDEGIVSNYNREGFQRKGLISIFNTSHISRNKGITEVAFELDEVDGWAKEIWTSYS